MKPGPDTAAVGDLAVEAAGSRYVVAVGETATIGRTAQAEIRLTDDRISRRHAIVTANASGWLVTDAGSANGMFVEGKRIVSLLVTGPTTIVLGAADGVVVRLAPVASQPVRGTPVVPRRPGAALDPVEQDWLSRPSAVHSLPSDVIRIGRAPDNQVVLTDLLASRHHAEIRTSSGRAELVDLKSGNGTFVNGHAVERVILRAGDLVTVGRHALRFDGTQLLEFVDSGDIRFSASGLVVALPDGRRILDDVSFSLGPRKVLAIVGPSGAGKSTLLGALTGIRPADEGQVLYGGRDLYAAYDELRQRIGLVPQQDILHQSLTVRQALEYGAQLRFPADASAAELSARVTEVIAELSLTAQSDSRISTLSGGERKRASTALELLTKPSLLFLDEPTSGLDTDLDRDVMKQLRALADEGRTIVVVTHNLVHLGSCDVVMVMARGGYVAYLGPPGEAFAYFGVQDWADLFGRLKERPGAEWAAELARRAEPRPSEIVAASGPRPMPALAPVRRRSGLSQFSTLSRRYITVTASDRTLLGIIVLLPAVLALIARIVPAPYGLEPAPGVNIGARQLLLVLAFGAALMGAASGVRELVKERVIYLRERAMGLSLPAYIASKVVVLGSVAIVQGIALTLLALAGRASPPDANILSPSTLEIVVAIAALCAVSAIVGLVISAIVRDENQAMPLLVLITMAQLVLCGGLVPIGGRAVLEQLSWLMPARWGFAAAASTADVNVLERKAPLDRDALWAHTAGTWLGDCAILLALGFLAVAALTMLVRRLDPNRRGR